VIGLSNDKSHKNEIRKSQRRWLKHRANCKEWYLNNSGLDNTIRPEECIKKIYNFRIRQLDDFAENFDSSLYVDPKAKQSRDIADGILKEALKNETGYYYVNTAEDDSLFENLYGVMSGPNGTEETNQHVFHYGCKAQECSDAEGFYFVDTKRKIFFFGIKPYQTRAGKLRDDKDRIYHIYYNDKIFLDQHIQHIHENKSIRIDIDKINYSFLSDKGEGNAEDRDDVINLSYKEKISNFLKGGNGLKVEKMDYYIKKDRFFTSEGDIPNGCFGQLMTKLNGDDVVAAIFVNRTWLRGCISSNYPGPSGISYAIKGSLGDHLFKIRVCAMVEGGSMNQYCDRILIKFVNRGYFIRPDELKTVLSIEKMGKW